MSFPSVSAAVAVTACVLLLLSAFADQASAQNDRIDACKAFDSANSPVYVLSPDSNNCGDLSCTPTNPPAEPVEDGYPCRCFSKCHSGACVPNVCYGAGIFNGTYVDACGVCMGNNDTCVVTTHTSTVNSSETYSFLIEASMLSITVYVTWSSPTAGFFVIGPDSHQFESVTNDVEWENNSGRFRLGTTSTYITYSGAPAAQNCGQGFIRFDNIDIDIASILFSGEAPMIEVTRVEVGPITTTTTTTTSTTNTMTTTIVETAGASSGSSSNTVIIGAAVGGGVAAVIIGLVILMKVSPKRFQRTRATGPTESVNPLFSQGNANNNYAAAYAAPPSQYADTQFS